MIEALSVAGGQGSYQFILNRYDATGTTIVLSSGPQTSPQFPWTWSRNLQHHDY
ncbi:hypothetical protein H9W95_03915 [Flavobacterium lindanitolerans]|nr:hypothetical protein [Flavobacterium lindanitolerans]